MRIDETHEQRFAEIGAALAIGLAESLPAWAGRVVAQTGARLGRDGSDVEAAVDESTLAVGRLVPGLRAALDNLVAADIDRQRSTPLSIARQAVPAVTAVLDARGWPAIERDPYASEQFPDDTYDLTPATLADIDPDLHEVGLTWGAAKAWLHRRRHRTRRVVVCAGMMDASRIESIAARTAGVEVVATPDADRFREALADPPVDLVIIDLTRPGALETALEACLDPDTAIDVAQVVAFGPHVADAVLASARSHGFDTMARSTFVHRVTDLLAALRPGAAPPRATPTP